MRWLASLVLFALSGAIAAVPQIPQALPPASMTLPQMPLHDPWILAYQPTHTYYLYTSNVESLTHTPGRGTMVYTSKDLKHWNAPHVVFTAAELTWATQGGWAPEVHPYRGHFYLFTTFHNTATKLPQSTPLGHDTYMRGTIVAVADSPDGPFRPLDPSGPTPPRNFMTLDGTLFLDAGGKPWLVYAHEWLQKIDGTTEAVPLKPDLSGTSGPPIYLFKGSDAPWIDAAATPNADASNYVTDGPELFRTHTGHLLMLWSSYEHNLYVQTIARSKSGTLQGPWEQLPPLLHHDSGHGMLFRTFDGKLMLIVHRPFHNARGKLYDVQDAGDHLRILRERTDLDGDPVPLTD